MSTPETKRLRPQITMTVHPDTVGRMESLTDRFKCSRGQLMDRLVQMVALMYESGKLYCLSGHPCQIGRQDVPPIL